MFTFSSEKVRVLADFLARHQAFLKRALVAAFVGVALAVAFNLGRAKGQDDILNAHPIKEIMFSRNAKKADLNMCAFDKPERLLICATVEEMMMTEGDL